MSGLVGIVSATRDARIDETELESLAGAYESLRGAGSRREEPAGSFARVAELRPGGDGARPDASAPNGGGGSGTGNAAGGSSWVLLTGTPHGADAHAGHDLAALDGQFAWCCYDAAREELSLATDPFGMQALYVAERDGRTYFSTSALALARHLRARPSALGLSLLLRAGYQFGSLTIWEGIERLEPGTRVRFTRAGATREVYWRPAVDRSVEALTLDEAASHCISVATETYRSYYGDGRGRGWSDLTGGYDSRLLVLLLRQAGLHFAVDTVGDEHSVDVRIAAEVARAAGWDWSRFDVPADWRELLPGLLEVAVGWGDCHLDALQLAEVLWGHVQKARVHPGLYIGGGGEHFRSYAWEQEFLNGGRSTHVNLDNWVDMKMLKPINTEVFVEDPSPQVREDLRRRMAAYAQPYSSHLNSVQLDMLYAYKCTGHFGAYLSAAAGVITPELPFYLKPVFEAAFSTSHRNRGAHRLMRRMIELLDPRLSAIETAKGGPAQRPRPSNLHRFAPYYAKVGRKAITKLSERVLHRALLLPSAPSDPKRAQARGALVESFDDGRPLRWEQMRSQALYKRGELDRLLERAGEPGLPDAGLLCRILTAELALRAADAALEG